MDENQTRYETETGRAEQNTSTEREIQNEELYRTQHLLEQSRRRYFRLYEFAPIGYITVRPDGRTLSANLTICDMLGRDRNAVVRAGLFGIIDGTYHSVVSELLRRVTEVPEERASTEARLTGDNGAFVRIDALRTRDQDGIAYEIDLSFTDISAAKLAEERAAATAEHNRGLLSELNHRVKNNLQLLLSIVMLQRRRARDENTEAALLAVEDRVRTVSFSHQSLEPEFTAGKADLVALLRPLLRQLTGRTNARLTFSSSEGELRIAGDTALSLALAVNELISNSIKHADDEPSITVRLELDSQSGEYERTLCLTISDTGPGLPEELLTRCGEETRAADTGLGFMLVSQLVEQQLDGTWIRRNHPEGGAEHEILVVV